MLIAVGMYLPFNTTFAIFVGGLIKLASDKFLKKRSADDKQKIKVANVGILVASGFIAGEALTGVLLAPCFAGNSIHYLTFNRTEYV